MENILDVELLRKTYSNFKLDDISFSLQKNKITGFIGTNGSGKTTTIKLILGLALKESGQLNYLIKKLDRMNVRLKIELE